MLAVPTPMGTTRPGRCITTPVTTCGRSVITHRRLTITARPLGRGTALAGAGRAGTGIAHHHHRVAGLAGVIGRGTGTVVIMTVVATAAGVAEPCAAAFLVVTL